MAAGVEAQRSHQERRHRTSGDEVLGAEHVAERRVAALGDLHRGYGIDVVFELAELVVEEDAVEQQGHLVVVALPLGVEEPLPGRNGGRAVAPIHRKEPTAPKCLEVGPPVTVVVAGADRGEVGRPQLQ